MNLVLNTLALAALVATVLWHSGLLNNSTSNSVRRLVGPYESRPAQGGPGRSDDGRGPPTDDSGNAYHPSSLIVRFAPNLPESAKAAARSAAGANSHKILAKALDIELLSFPNAGGLAAKISALQNNPNVQYAEYDYELHSIQTANPNDPQFGSSEMWGVKGGWGSNAVGAWGKGYLGSRDVIVGVIDTGIDYNHQDLADNMWQNPGEIPGDGKDNDNNGYVDDVYGLDSVNGDSDPWDNHFHGTHCSGTIGAVGNNNVGVVGVNWLVRIIAGKFLSSSGSGSTSGAVILVDYMTNLKLAGNNIRVLSNSWGGGGFSQSLLDSINRAGDADILFVAAAGNDNTNTDTTPSYPQGYQCVTKANGTPRGYDCVISVASITSTGARSSFSNYGATTVDIGAPGSSILSTYLNNNYNTISGTSMATPHVSGALAMCAAGNPNLTARQLKEYLMQSAAPTSSMSGITVTGGRLDVSALMDLCATPCSTDGDCNDSKTCTTDTCSSGFCINVPIPECCGDDVCTSTEETSGSCPEDCCGNGKCSAIEKLWANSTCTADCCYTPSDCPPGPNQCFPPTCSASSCGIDTLPNCCGNGLCEPGASETAAACPQDCGERELETTFQGGNSQNGNFFNIDVINDIRMKGFKINIGSDPSATVEVYYYPGSYNSVMSNAGAWAKLVGPITVASGTMITFPTPKLLEGSATHSFYVTRTDSGNLAYTNGNSENAVYKQDLNIIFKEGRGAVYPFGSTFVPRIWNGALVYTPVPPANPPPSQSPTTNRPSQSPSKKPTNSPTSSTKPSLSPSTSPSTAPSVSLIPTNVPTPVPSKNPTTSPTKKPTSAPTEKPTAIPSRKPTPAPTYATYKVFICTKNEPDQTSMCNTGERLVGSGSICEYNPAQDCGPGSKKCWFADCIDLSGPTTPSPTTHSTPSPTAQPMTCVENDQPCPESGPGGCCSGNCSKGKNKACIAAKL